MSSAPRRLPPLLGLFCLLTLVACHREKARTDAATQAAPATMPASTVLELATDDADAVLGGLRAQFRDPAAGVPIPEDAAEIVELWIALPQQIRRHIPSQTRVRALYLRSNGGTRSAIAVKMRLERDAQRPFGVEVSVLPGGPHGSRWIIGRPPASGPRMALLGDVLVAADDGETLETSLRWLAEKRMSEDVGQGLVLRLPAGSIGGFLRPMVDALVEEGSASAIASARAERAQHEEAPALGDPEQVVTTVRDRLRRLLGYFPDAGEATLRLVTSANGVELDGVARVEPRSPLSRALAEARVGAPYGFGALPRGTALAVSTRRTPGETPWVDVLGPIAGGRMSAEERGALSAAGERLSSMRGEASLVAVGSHEDGPFVFAGLAASSAALEPSAVSYVFAVPYVANAIGSLVGCESVRLGSLAQGRANLCRVSEAPYPDLSVRTGTEANAIIVAARPSQPSGPHAAAEAFVAAPDSIAREGLFGDPDGERALASLGEETLFAMVVSSGALMPSLGILGSPGLRRFAAGRPLPTAAHPILFALRRDQGNLGVRLVATPRAIEETWAVFYLVHSLMGGE